MSHPPPFFLFLLFPYFLFPLIFIPPSAPPFRSSSTFYLFGEIYQQFSLFTTNSLVLSRAGIPGHDQEWVLQLIRGRLFIYSRLEERFLPPSKDSPTFQPSCNFDASQKKKKKKKENAISTTAGLCIIKRRATIHRRTTFASIAPLLSFFLSPLPSFLPLPALNTIETSIWQNSSTLYTFSRVKE